MDIGTHETPPPIAWCSDALRDVAAERRRQIEIEGWTPYYDDAHTDGELATAAACYAHHDPVFKRAAGKWIPADWPWSATWWNPKDRRRDLVRAAALLLAEIERLDRRLTPNAELKGGN